MHIVSCSANMLYIAVEETSYVMHNNLDYSTDVCSRRNHLCIMHLDALYLLLLCVVLCAVEENSYCAFCAILLGVFCAVLCCVCSRGNLL